MAPARLVPSLLALGLLAFTACKQRADAPTAAVLDDQTWSFPEPQVSYPIAQFFGSGQKLEIAVDPNRQIEQVTVSWDVDYTIVERDAAGQPVLNDEGKPRYKDGLYAYGFIVSASGSKAEIATKKFIDADETDNWHDLQQVRGPKLLIEFWHAQKFSNDPAVVAAQRKARVYQIIVRYVDAPGQMFEDFVYNSDPYDSMSSAAVAIEPGSYHRVNVDKSLRVYRVDVRWGDEKPRVDGVYIPGTAMGQLRINGSAQGSSRNVAAVETQVFTGLQYPPSNQAQHNIDILFSSDKARVHWVRVYYLP